MNIEHFLVEIRRQIEPTTAPLEEARSRLKLVRESAESFTGCLRTYRSGSLAVHTMNEPVTDGDGGIILNRNFYPSLGPEGKGEAPGSIVDELCDHLRPLIRKQYPNASIHKSKRGPEIHFGDPIDGQDPTVDLVVALNRKDGEGIWIPNLETGLWEASDPEEHVSLLNGDSKAFRSTRRKIVRLAKAWNKQYSSPGASSFMLSVWALEFVEFGQGVASGLLALFDSAASRLEAGESTADPAGVSKALKLIETEKVMGARLRIAAKNLAAALEAENESDAQEAMSLLFWKYIDAPRTADLKAAATLVGTGKPVAAATIGIAVSGTTTAGARAFGGDR